MVKVSEKDFILAVNDLGIKLTNEQIRQFSIYANYLLEYNKKTNLTAIRNIDDVYLKHFYDSILINKYFDFTKKSLIDIGSGAGFPGIPLKIINPDIKLTLLDSNGKKTRFLSSLLEKLEIEATVINDRAEKYVLKMRESFDVVVSRAVKEMPILAEISIPFVKVNGYFISYKGNLDETLENGIFAIETLGCEIKDVIKDFLPFENSIRTFVIARKKCQTKCEYPRVFDKINKKPLQKK